VERARRSPDGPPAVIPAYGRTRARLGGVVGSSPAEIVGFGVAWFLLIAIAVQLVATVAEHISHDWWPAYDTNAYWLAAHHLLDGSPLYQPALITTSGAYKYPPILAQVAIPIGLLPERIVDWAWRILGVLCLRYLCGSWKLAVIAALQWPAMAELDFGNVTLQLGAAALACFGRGRMASAGMLLLPWFGAAKVGPALLIAYLWATRPEARRTLAAGCALFAAACALSFVAAPGLWFDYAGTFGWEASSRLDAWFVVAIVPDHGALDFVIRLAIALLLLAAAVRWRLEWLAFVIVAATMPILSLTRLAILVGLWPLWLRGLAEKWRAGGGRLARWLTAPLAALDMIPPGECPAAR
jgi:hypothetical protein